MMKVDGKLATSGSIVIGPRQKAEISLSFGNFELVFNPSKTPKNVQLTTNPPQIVFDGMDNVLGTGTTLTIPLPTGTSLALTFVIHAIGDGSTTYRLIHYTVG